MGWDGDGTYVISTSSPSRIKLFRVLVFVWIEGGEESIDVVLFAP